VRSLDYRHPENNRGTFSEASVYAADYMEQANFFLDVRLVNVTMLQLRCKVRHFVNWLFML